MSAFDAIHADEMRVAEARHLRMLRERLRPAGLRGEQRCVRCGYCCHARACRPTPEELRVIAEFFGLSGRDLILQHFVIDCISEGGPHFVRPAGANTRDLVGRLLPADRTYNEGACIFLSEDSECTIYAIRPREARAFLCWDADSNFDPVPFWHPGTLETILGDDAVTVK